MKMEADLQKEMPNGKAIGLVFNVISLVLSIMMVVAAVGLLMRGSWGRTLCMIAAVLLIIVALANVIYQATSVLPVTMKMQEEMLRQQNPNAAPPPGMFKAIGYGTLIVMAVFMIGYPILAFGMMMMGSVRAFYSGSRRDSFDGPDDDFDDRRRDRDDDRRRDDWDEGGRDDDDRIRR